MEPTIMLARSSPVVIFIIIVGFFLFRFFLRRHRLEAKRQAWRDYDLAERERRVRSENPVVEIIDHQPKAPAPRNVHSAQETKRETQDNAMLFQAIKAPHCPVCEHPTEEQVKRCPSCGASHHPECWILNDGCGSCGFKN